MSKADPMLIEFSNEIPELPPDGTLVARKRDGTFVTLLSGRLSLMERLVRPYNGYAVVTKRVLFTSFVLELLSATKPRCFTVRLDLHVRVVDPIEMLSNGITDIRSALLIKLQNILKAIASKFRIDQHLKVEKECQNALYKFEIYGLEIVETWSSVEIDRQISQNLLRRVGRGESGKQDIEADQQRMAALLSLDHPRVMAEMLKNVEQHPYIELDDLIKIAKELETRGRLENWEVPKYIRRWFEQNSKGLKSELLQQPSLIKVEQSEASQTLVSQGEPESIVPQSKMARPVAGGEAQSKVVLEPARADVYARVNNPWHQWIVMHLEELEKYRDREVAIDYEHGVVVDAADDAEFASKLCAYVQRQPKPEDARARLLVTHASLYLDDQFHE